VLFHPLAVTTHFFPGTVSQIEFCKQLLDAWFDRRRGYTVLVCINAQAGYTAGGDTNGSQTVKVAPLPGELSTVIRPE